MGLEALASLIIAASDLTVVRLIRDAIRTADIASGKLQAAAELGPAPDAQPRRIIHPAPVYEPRQQISSTPHFGRRAGLYISSRATHWAERPRRIDAVCAAPSIPDAPRPILPMEGPFPPVWKTLPPLPGPDSTPPRRVIKVIRYESDIRNKGLVVDMHI